MPQIINWTEEIAFRITDAAAAFDGYDARERHLVGALVFAGGKECPHLVEALIGSSVIEDTYFTEEVPR